jgi:hypothetical protein
VATSPKITKKPPPVTPKKQNNLRFVVAAQDVETDKSPSLKMHKEVWIGAVNLPKDCVK